MGQTSATQHRHGTQVHLQQFYQTPHTPYVLQDQRLSASSRTTLPTTVRSPLIRSKTCNHRNVSISTHMFFWARIASQIARGVWWLTDLSNISVPHSVSPDISTRALGNDQNPSSPSNPSKTYTFVSLPGTAIQRRPRRRYDEIERLSLFVVRMHKVIRDIELPQRPRCGGWLPLGV